MTRFAEKKFMFTLYLWGYAGAMRMEGVLERARKSRLWVYLMAVVFPHGTRCISSVKFDCYLTEEEKK